MIKKLCYLLIIALLGLILILISRELIADKFSVSSDTYYVTKITQMEKSIDINGGTTDKTKRFTGFHVYIVKGDSLYIKPFYSVTASSNRNSDFSLGCKMDKSKIKKVYLVGKKNNDVKLIWSSQPEGY